MGPDHNDLAREDMPDTMRAKRDDCAGSPDAAPGCALPDREHDKLDALREVETRRSRLRLRLESAFQRPPRLETSLLRDNGQRVFQPDPFQKM